MNGQKFSNFIFQNEEGNNFNNLLKSEFFYDNLFEKAQKSLLDRNSNLVKHINSYNFDLAKDYIEEFEGLEKIIVFEGKKFYIQNGLLNEPLPDEPKNDTQGSQDEPNHDPQNDEIIDMVFN